MARAVWTGSLSFGLVNVPVALFSATEEKSIHFNQFEAGTSDRVRNKRVNERTGEEVPYDKVVKGFDLGGGEYVILAPDEVASVAPGRSRTIDVSGFVDLGEIDPVYFEKAYYLAPPGKGGAKGGERAYALLRDAMIEANKVALATFVLREKQYLAAIRPREDALVLETLRYADEVREPVQEIDTLPVDASFDTRELEMARLLIDTMTTDWEPERYHDAYRERLESMIDQKRSGATVEVEPQAPEGAPVVDLLQALEASVRASRAGAGAPAAGSGSGSGVAGRRRSPAKSAGSAGAAGNPSKAATTASPRDELSTLPKSELLRRAAGLDIAGRTKMDRDELVAAVRAASVPATRRRKAS